MVSKFVNDFVLVYILKQHKKKKKAEKRKRERERERDLIHAFVRSTSIAGR
jgi:hypothetical protein